MVALLLGLFMAAMEMTVVSTAMPTVVADLGGADHYAWVFSAYMLTSTVCVPIHGKLADLYGRKPVLLAAMALFLVGSMASGQARSMSQLIFFRALQGVGAGGLQPVAITVVGDIFGIEERARMQGVFGAVWAIAGLVGPLLGGVIVGSLSWRWVFYVNVPFGVLSGAILSFALVENIAPKKPRLDFLGAALLSGAVVTLLLGTEGVAPWVLLPAAAVLAFAFVAVERWVAPEPMLPVTLFTGRLLGIASLLFTVAGAAMMGLVTFVPLYAQGVAGASPTQAGATIAPMAIGWPIASAVSGRLISKVGFRALVRSGMLVVSASAIGLAVTLTHGGGLGALRVVAACFGIGMGIANTALIVSVQTSVDFSRRGVATASTMFFRNIGGTVGVGIMGVILARGLASGGHGSVASEALARLLRPEGRGASVPGLSSIADDLARGVGWVGWTIAGLSGVAAVVSFFYPTVKIPDQSR